MKSYDALVFDLGGVVIRYRGRPPILAWLKGRLTAEELWRWWLVSPLVRAYETGSISSAVFAAGIVAEFGLPVSAGEYLASFAESHEAVYAGAAAFLDRLAPRYTLAALSNTNEALWGRCAALGILSHFHYLFPSHTIGRVKPDRGIFFTFIISFN
jgi:putative hydrolase of the HAD superfamily